MPPPRGVAENLRALRNIRTLVVDDEPDIRRVVTRILGATPGIDVVGAAASGEEAVELNRQLRPDVIVLDQRMPDGKNGIETATALQAEHDGLIIIMFSADRDDALMLEARSSRVAVGVEKPNLARLASMVVRLGELAVRGHDPAIRDT